MTKATLDDKSTKNHWSTHNNDILQDSTGLNRLVAVLKLVGGVRACHLESVATGAHDDPSCFGEGILRVGSLDCEWSASTTTMKARRTAAL
jgi:hypothetical protein